MTPLYKIDDQQGPLYSTGNYIQYNGKESETEYIYICIYICKEYYLLA